jgi:putative transposase
LVELNRLFTAWVETVYHVREHSETGQPPLARALSRSCRAGTWVAEFVR